jgi:hypothetical protein
MHKHFLFMSDSFNKYFCDMLKHIFSLDAKANLKDLHSFYVFESTNLEKLVKICIY